MSTETASWRMVRETLGDDLLAPTVGVAPRTLRGYAAGDSRPAEDVQLRADVLVRALDGLAGSYSSDGIRAWLGRSRAALGGRSPSQVIADAGRDDREALDDVVRLAGALAETGAS